MSDLDLDALEATARSATPGPWSINWESDEYHAGMPDRWALSINGPEASDFADLAAADAEHMATFDPPTVLALIAKLREAEAVIAEALELIATVKVAGEVPVDVFAIERILARSKPTNQEGES